MVKRMFLIIIITFMSFGLVACYNNEDNNTTVKVLLPAGGPALGMAQMMHEVSTINDTKIEYEVVSGPESLVAGITSASHEIVIAPTNLGAKLYNGGSNYLFAGTISLGSLFLVSKEDISIEDLENETILAFGKNSTPDIILRKLLDYNNMLDKVNIEYLNSVSDVNAQFIAGNYKVALLAEPSFSVTRKSTDTYTVMDLQDEYKKMTGNESYPQASVFIKKEFADENKELTNEFINKVSESIIFANTYNEVASYFYTDLNIYPNIPIKVLASSIPNSNLSFIDVKDSKELVNEYLDLLFEFNPQSIGGKMPNSEFYL